ncbi:MAG: hypothetical protein HW398_1126, partial [Acidobacteria bacterium]|nr:hypothetical protein [Acidobacteriota bacterium]
MPLVNEFPGGFGGQIAGYDNDPPEAVRKIFADLLVELLAGHSAHPHVAQDGVVVGVGEFREGLLGRRRHVGDAMLGLQEPSHDDQRQLIV